MGWTTGIDYYDEKTWGLILVFYYVAVEEIEDIYY